MPQALDTPASTGGYDPSVLCRMADEIGKHLSGFERFKIKYRPRICPFHVLMDYVPVGARVLDIGSGMGLWLLLISRAGILGSGLGIEVHRQLAETANRLASERDSLNFQYNQPDQPWPSGDFDCLTLIDVLHHVPRNGQEEFLARIKQTGARRVIFKDIDSSAVFGAAMNTLHDLAVSVQIPKYPDPQKVTDTLENMGYTIVASRKIRMLWYPHYYIVADLAKDEPNNQTTIEEA